MAYRVIISPAAERQIGRLRGASQIAVRGVILALAQEPRPSGALKVAGLSSVWRVRVRVDGRPWRLFYRIDERHDEIVIFRVVRRDEDTYRGLK